MSYYDFIDIGSSKGGSVRFAQRHFGKNGYGIDIDERKVKQAQADGYDVRHQDIYKVKDRARWCTCLHVIEHLSGREEARRMIKRMTEIADNVLIIFPNFDEDGWLYDHGLKFFWSDWTGHPYHCTRLELRNILRDLDVRYRIEQAVDVRGDEIISIDAAVDSFEGVDKYEFDPKMKKETRCAIGDTTILDRI